MNLNDLLRLTITSLSHQKLRSFLTVLGIVVGISSVILLIGLIQGLKSDVLEQLEEFGPRTILITPKQSGSIGSSFMPTSGKLYEKDYERLKRIPEIESITKIISGRTTMVFKNQSIAASIYGIEADLFDDTVPVELNSGRFLDDNDKGVVCVGNDIAENFDEIIKTQANVYLNKNKFKVIGVLKPTGNSFAPIDSVVFMSFSDAKNMFKETLVENEISSIRLTLKEGSDVDSIAEEIEDIMLSSHRLTEDEKDFEVISPKFINERFTSILDLLSLFLGSIASISLVVGGIGIANTMFMNVIERRKEVGIMKAVGGTREQIRNIFLFESAFVGLLGGIIGVLLAVFISYAVVSLAGISFVFDPLVVFGALVFSIAVGLISGTIPAIEAAKVDAIIALRYE